MEGVPGAGTALVLTRSKHNTESAQEGHDPAPAGEEQRTHAKQKRSKPSALHTPAEETTSERTRPNSRGVEIPASLMKSAAYTNDPKFTDYEFLHGMQYKDGLWFMDDKVVVPNSPLARQRIMQEHHDTALAGGEKWNACSGGLPYNRCYRLCAIMRCMPTQEGE